MSVSTRTRFEIFKRDGFTCIYCGAAPTAGPLHVDHVTPQAEGGSDDPSNLVTACERCNLGKSAVPLDRKRFDIGDPTIPQRDHAQQILAYLELQKQKVAAEMSVVDALADHWAALDGGFYPRDFEAAALRLSREFTFDELRHAITLANGYYNLKTLRRWKIFHGITRRWRETGDRT
jgi:hypothetical protein